MNKVFQIARREFLATVTTKAFIIGLLFLPCMILFGVVVAPRLFNMQDFRVSGEVTIVDPTTLVSPLLRAALTEGTAEARRAEAARGARADGIGTDLVRNALAMPPALRLREHSAGADLAAEKAWLLAGSKNNRRIAIVVIHADAVQPSPGSSDYGSYDMYLSPGVDTRAEIAVHQSVREAIVSARISASGLNRDIVNALVTVPRVQATTVTPGSETRFASGFNFMLPMAFMVLLFIGVLGGGQALMTSTVEEKSSRVIEVLLSAVSPLELMAGKLLGHLAIGLLTMSLYIGLSLATLWSFSMFGLLQPLLILYLLIFFLITYFMIGSVMLAVGAAVNELSETQSLMMPIMMVLMAPMFLFMPITSAPDSTFSTVISFIPPVNTFAMLVRLASTSPPPVWQVGLSMAIGVAAAYGALWFAAKVFRIGLLLHGKPPDFATLVRWVRAA